MPTIGISLPSHIVEELERVTGKSASEAIKEMVLRFFEKRQLSHRYLEIYRIALRELSMAIEISKRDPKAITLAIAKIASFIRSSIALLRQITYDEKWSALGTTALLWMVDYLEREALLSSDPHRGSMSLGGLSTLAMALMVLVPILLPLSEKEYSDLVEDMKMLFEKLQSGKS